MADAAGPPEGTPVRALRDILGHTTDGRTALLAMRQVCGDRDPSDVAIFARLASGPLAASAVQVPRFSSPHGGPQVVTYTRTTVGEDALRNARVLGAGVDLGREPAAGGSAHLTGADPPADARAHVASADTPERLRAWVAAHPDAAHEPAAWERVIRENGRSPAFDRMPDREPDAWIRVAMGAPTATGFMPRRLAGLLRTRVGDARLVPAVTARAPWPWPELADPRIARAASGWILDHAENVFEKPCAAWLPRMWDDRGDAGAGLPRAKLGLAVARMHPEKAQRALHDALVETHEEAVFVALVTRFLVEEQDLIVAQIGVAPWAPERHVLREIAKRGAPALPSLRAVASSDAFPLADVPIVELAFTALALERQLVLPKVGLLTKRLMAADTHVVFQGTEAQLDEARRDTLARVRAWLNAPVGSDGGPPR